MTPAPLTKKDVLVIYLLGVPLLYFIRYDHTFFGLLTTIALLVYLIGGDPQCQAHPPCQNLPSCQSTEDAKQQ